jgi:branched-chain amino acid transport system substrate-binding protein
MAIRISRPGAFALALSALAAAAGPSAAEDTVKVAYIDPLSGPGATVGLAGINEIQYLAEQANAKGGAAGRKIEILPLDNKTNPQESLVQAQKAADAGARIITQGNGSSVALALTDWVRKYNERNPGKEMLYLNYAAIDPALTNKNCNFWHFRWDANVDMKMQALTNFMKGQTAIKKVYLINQDYSFGHSVRAAARAMLKEKRPDIEIVGDEVHPLLKVTDFSPYIAKIKESGADSVITGNWSQDIALLLKAAADAGLQTNWYTYYAGGPGGPTAIKQANLNHRVFGVAESVPNLPVAASREYEKAYRAKYHASIFYPRLINEVRMLTAAAGKAGSTEPLKIALALEDMKWEILSGGEGWMRKEDHQFFQPLYIASFGERSGDEPFDEENTGWGWRVIGKVDTKDTEVPTTCKMDRPAS